jgi:hypothetical protein
MELKVREVSVEENKSVQEVEQELVEKHQQELNEDTTSTEGVVANESTEDVIDEAEGQLTSKELGDDDVLEYIRNRYNKDISSMDDLLEEKSSNEELPEDVAAYYEYKQKTGRGMSDYIKLNRDFDKMDDNQLLKEFYIANGDAFDMEDVELLMSEFSYDEDLDDENDIKRKKLAMKKVVKKAKGFFNDQKQMYKEPLESSSVQMSEDDKKEQEAYRQYIEQSKTYEQEVKRKREWFEKKTNEVFSDFKGFDFNLGDTTLSYKPSNADEIQKSQLSPQNFIAKYLDDNGMMNDAAGYHRSLAVAMNPEKFAKFFYEQGAASATENVTRKIKNIQMDERKAPEVTKKGGTQFRSVNNDSGRGLKIKSKRK